MFVGEIVERVVSIRDEAGLSEVPIRLITNGSLVHRPEVQDALKALSRAGGEVWFKVDGGTQEDIARINGVDIKPQAHAHRLALCASLCPTWVQTCLFRWDGASPTQAFMDAYMDILKTAGTASLKGILLYGVARPSFQPEAVHLQRLSPEELEAIATRLRDEGLAVAVSP